jgi:hypothetical protein
MLVTVHRMCQHLAWFLGAAKICEVVTQVRILVDIGGNVALLVVGGGRDARDPRLVDVDLNGRVDCASRSSLCSRTRI